MLGNVDPQFVKASPWVPAVYIGRDNFVAAMLSQYDSCKRQDVPLDLTQVNRLVLVLPEINLSFDSAVAPDVMDWTSHDRGVIEFKLSGYAIRVGSYKAQLIAYDAEHPNGQVILSGLNTRNDLVLNINEVNGSGPMPTPLPTGGDSAVRTAGETISALRVVYERGGAVYLLDPTDPYSEDVQYVLGITATAAQVGESIVVQRSGTIDQAGWTWAEGLVFVGVEGRLTQIPPTTGWELVVGFAPSETRVNIDFDEPVLLN